MGVNLSSSLRYYFCNTAIVSEMISLVNRKNQAPFNQQYYILVSTYYIKIVQTVMNGALLLCAQF